MYIICIVSSYICILYVNILYVFNRDETYLGNGKEGGDNDLWTEGQGDRDDLWAGENDEGMYESETLCRA